MLCCGLFEKREMIKYSKATTTIDDIFSRVTLSITKWVSTRREFYNLRPMISCTIGKPHLCDLVKKKQSVAWVLPQVGI